MRTRAQYIAAETSISVIINVALSIGFVFLIFHGQSLVPATGSHGVALDMAPQTFMVCLMSFLVPALLTRKRLRSGALTWHPGDRVGPNLNIFLLAGSFALLAAALAVALSMLVLPSQFPSGIRFHALLISKAIFGGLLAAMVTPYAIGKVLRPHGPTDL